MHTFELPSGLEIELREMTGAEEELLTNQRLIRTGDAVNQALKNCIVRLGDNDEPTVKDVLDLLSGDRLFVLVRLRQISLGDEVELELTCPNTACRAANAVTVKSGERRHGQPRGAGGHALRRGTGVRVHAARFRGQGSVRLFGRPQGETPGCTQRTFHLLGHVDPNHRRGRSIAEQKAHERHVDA
ncbi:hypothetical protein TRIP_B120097 [uncultured Desulfatiglans sp.]|nr:hypothetical protein TRIP_B120097 [uncultured Desulfatiglans sp.]